jgi:hypothetical protein
MHVGDMGSPVKSWNTCLIPSWVTLATLPAIPRTYLTSWSVHPRIRPDVRHCDENRKGAVDINDLELALHYNLQSTYASKINKYREVAEEAKKMWQLNRAHIRPLFSSTRNKIRQRLANKVRTEILVATNAEVSGSG